MKKMQTIQMRSLPQSQRGASLIVTIVVLTALTVVALAVTSSNQTQSIMVRNNQFRLETFNVSYSEIDAQIDYINKRRISEGIPAYILKMIDNAVGTRVWDKATDTASQISLRATTDNSYMDRDVAQVYRGICVIFGQQIGAGNEKIRCDDIKIESTADLKNTSVESEQHQVYEYTTLK